MMRAPAPPRFDCDPSRIVAGLLERDRRVLLLGQPGTGKTTLAAAIAGRLHADGRRVGCVGADPGSPAFGVPGAVSLGAWSGGGWACLGLEALCSLDAARFRLPLVSAVANLVREAPPGTLLLDAPGVTRGVAGAELLTSLLQAARVDLVLVLSRDAAAVPLNDELRAAAVEFILVEPASGARRPGKGTRALRRTRLWDAYLAGSFERTLPFAGLRLTGTPPRRAREAWLGKQVALLEGGKTVAMGEVTAMDEQALGVLLPPGCPATGTLLVRDAGRGADGRLGTGRHFAERLIRYAPGTDLLPDGVAGGDGGPRPVAQVGTAVAALVNGVFGDPLLHLRLRHERRSLLFDLGDGSRLPARIAHQVSDVFVTHAHVDHIGGFLWLLRSRIGESETCRLHGPPGLAARVSGLIDGILWDRIGDRGPRFQVSELHGDRVRRYRLQAGVPGCDCLGEAAAADGVLLDEQAFRVRAVTLDHGTPVLAFAYEPAPQVNVRRERLEARGLRPGPWLNRLKEHMRAGESGRLVTLPDGSAEPVEALAAALTLTTPGERLVYATDFADDPANRRKIVGLAQGAHTLFCEASFLETESEQARRTGHLTGRACGEIAELAGVGHLVPFHFSRRYEREPWRVYREIAAVTPRVVMPSRLREAKENHAED